MQLITGEGDKGKRKRLKVMERVYGKVDVKRLGLVKDDAYNQDKGRRLTIIGNHQTLPQCSNEGVILCGLRVRHFKR